MVVDMIKNYGRDQKGNATLPSMFNDSISKVFDELKAKDNGDLISRAVIMVYIKNTHTVYGAAEELHTSRNTIANYLSWFVYRVAELVGLK